MVLLSCSNSAEEVLQAQRALCNPFSLLFPVPAEATSIMFDACVPAAVLPTELSLEDFPDVFEQAAILDLQDALVSGKREGRSKKIVLCSSYTVLHIF